MLIGINDIENGKSIKVMFGIERVDNSLPNLSPLAGESCFVIGHGG